MAFVEQQRRHHDGQDLWDKIWKDPSGKIVIWQMPNIPLISWALFTTMSLIFSGRVADIFSWIGSLSLVIWSVLEIVKGVNYFRRALGLVVLMFAIATIIKLLH